MPDRPLTTSVRVSSNSQDQRPGWIEGQWMAMLGSSRRLTLLLLCAGNYEERPNEYLEPLGTSQRVPGASLEQSIWQL